MGRKTKRPARAPKRVGALEARSSAQPEPVDHTPHALAKFRALQWQNDRVTHDSDLVAKEPRDILRAQKVQLRPVASEPTPDDPEDARDLAVVLASDTDGPKLAPTEPDEEDVRETATRFAFKYHQRCRGRGYTVVAGRAIICKCSARKMAAYIDEESPLVPL